MRLKQVYITLDKYKYEPLVQTEYQYFSNYLSLFISDWVFSKKMDLGLFNRIVFRENDFENDLRIVGNKAFRVSLIPEFSNLQAFDSELNVHNYFISKYEEGFLKVDKNFNTSITTDLMLSASKYFEKNLFYEKVAKSFNINKEKYFLMHRYTYKKYNLILKKKDNIENNVTILFECPPDPFKVHFEISYIEIDEESKELLIFNQTRLKHISFKI